MSKQRIGAARPSNSGARGHKDIGADVEVVEEILGVPRGGIGRREGVGILSEGEVVALLYRSFVGTGALFRRTDAGAVKRVGVIG